MDFIGRTISAEERALADKLQSDIRNKIQKDGMSTKDVAFKTGLFETGVKTMMERKYWDLNDCIEIATCLGMKISIYTE